ncbi:MAG: tetratricopeptide repeat protein [Chloroflexi bacterium]|nr:tetratricopeptide repeat protein [Chloroflexota bacterium]
MPSRTTSEPRVPASEALSTARRLLEAGQSSALLDYLATVPEPDDDPELVLIRAEAGIYSGDTHKTVALTNHLLSAGISLSHELRARGLLLRASALRLRGFLEQAIEDASAAIQLLDQRDCDPRTLGQAHKQLGIPLAMQGDLAGAISHFEAALNLCSRVPDLNLQAEIHVSLGITCARAGRLSEAATHYQNALVAYEKEGRRTEIATLHNNIGRLHHDRGEYQAALGAYEKGLQIAREFRYVRTESMVLVNIGDTRREMGDQATALTAYRQALDVAIVAQEPRVTCCANIGIGVSYRILGESGKARFHLDQAVYEADRLQLAWELAVARLEAGILALATERHAEAVRLLSSSALTFEKQGAAREVVRSSLYLGDAYRRAGQHRELRTLLRRLDSTIREVSVDWHLARDARATSELLAYASNMDRGERLLAPLHAAVMSQQRDWKGAGGRTRPGSKEPGTMPRLEIRSFGGFAMRLDADLATAHIWEGQKAQELFVLLLCQTGGKTCEELLEILSRDDAPAPNRRVIHNNIYRIRRAVYQGCVILDHGRYRVDRSCDIWFDLEEFQKKSNSGLSETSNRDRKASLLEEAAELYRGEFLAGSYSDWVLDLRHRTEAQYVSNLVALSSVQQQLGNLTAALSALDRVLIVDPSNAHAHEHAISIEEMRGNLGEAHRRSKNYESIGGSRVRLPNRAVRA